MNIWIIGRKATLAANGHEYIAEPFIAFQTLHEAEAGAALVKRVSGETVSIVEVPMMIGGKANLQDHPS